MAGIQLVGNGGTVTEVDGTSYRALRTTNRPTDYSSFGHYHLAMVSGTVAAALAANAVIFSFRWSDATRLAVVWAIRVRFQALTLFTAATLTDFGFDAFTGRTFTAAHTGGTAATITGNSMKLRASMGTTLVNDIRISSTAALGGGTITADGNAFAMSIGDTQRVNPAAATEEQSVNNPTLEWRPDVAAGAAPLILVQNEGFVVRNRAAWPLAGTGAFTVEVAWAEVSAY